MRKTKRARPKELLARSASLVLAIAVWFLISEYLLTKKRQGESLDAPADILGPAVNPDLQGEATKPEEPKPVETTVH